MIKHASTFEKLNQPRRCDSEIFFVHRYTHTHIDTNTDHLRCVHGVMLVLVLKVAGTPFFSTDFDEAL